MGDLAATNAVLGVDPALGPKELKTCPQRIRRAYHQRKDAPCAIEATSSTTSTVEVFLILIHVTINPNDEASGTNLCVVVAGFAGANTTHNNKDQT
jgi:hypothetical protein